MYNIFRINNRPISPHLSIYSPQFSSLFSIWHRITGIVLSSVLSIFLLYSKLFITFSFYYLSILNDLFFVFININWVSTYLYLLILFFLIYHVLNGVRHIIWDMGLFLNTKSIFLSSLFSIFLLSLIIILNIIKNF